MITRKLIALCAANAVDPRIASMKDVSGIALKNHRREGTDIAATANKSALTIAPHVERSEHTMHGIFGVPMLRRRVVIVNKTAHSKIGRLARNSIA